MSAYIVENKTINRIVEALLYSRDTHSLNGPLPAMYNKWLKEFSQDEPEEIGLALYGMNYNAVMQRYSDLKRDELPGPIEAGYKYSDEPITSAIQIYKSLQCYLYQCSEGDVPELPLYKALDAYQHEIADHMITNTPEYERAAWG
jgi:hypothetical protein